MNNEDAKVIKRPPVVVVVGHVDHGKTSLLDFIRKSNVAAKEAGSITQSIGAYEISHMKSAPSPSGSGNANAPMRIETEKITFIDTPGHEAFSKMRIRGADVADVAILVVAADEGVKPQTKEAIRVLKVSETPFVVAITKIDKPSADIEKVKNDLMSNDVFLEGSGGNVSYQGVSSKTGEGINELLDLILLTADMEDLKYNQEEMVRGIILESKMDNRRGSTVTVILKNGILKKGDMIMTATAKGKIKMMEDFLGHSADKFIPSSPVVVLGFENLPQIGEEFKAGDLSEGDLSGTKAFKNERGIFTKKDSVENKNIIRIILKADVAGSLEALVDILKNSPLNGDKKIEIMDSSVGNITDGDVNEAVSLSAIIVGFKVKTDKAAENLARGHNIIIITNEIIYKLVEDVQKISLEIDKEQTGSELEILAVFSGGANKQTVGGKVIRGQLKNKSRFEIQRAGEAIGNGKIVNLQQNKKDVFVVNEGSECGLVFETNVKIEAGDKLLNK